MTEFKGHSLFNEDENRIRRAWNRCQVISNIREDKGDELAQQYFDSFDSEEKMSIIFLLEVVNQFGKEVAQTRVMEAIENEDAKLEETPEEA